MHNGQRLRSAVMPHLPHLLQADIGAIHAPCLLLLAITSFTLPRVHIITSSSHQRLLPPCLLSNLMPPTRPYTLTVLLWR
jgi:hypothetical protein